MSLDSTIYFSTTVPAKKFVGTLFDLGMDALIVGNNYFGLRLPTDFDLPEIKDLLELARQKGKKIIVAANAILHNDQLPEYREYLRQLVQAKVDYIMVGDAGAVNILQNNFPQQKFIYFGEVLDTNSGMMNFWGNEGASFVRLARELPYVELKELIPNLRVTPIIQLFGPISIQQSGRNLIYNYLDYVGNTKAYAQKKVYQLALPQKPKARYTMFEDHNGTHMFAPEDLNLIAKMPELYDLGIRNFTFDGLFYQGKNWNDILKEFNQARQVLLNFNSTSWNHVINSLKVKLPADRHYSTGFYDYQMGDIK